MPTRHCQLPLKTTVMEQLLHKETKSFLKTRKRGPPKTNDCQNGRMPVKCSNHLHHCQISRDIYLGSLVQIIAFTSKNPAGHKEEQ